MSVSDESIQPTSDSFFEVGNYKYTIKRIDDGYKLCNDLMALIQERADIEKAYAKNLKTWSKKWNDAIDKGPEYGTTQGAWNAVLHEAVCVSEIHLEVKNKLINEVQTMIKQWQKENFHKNMVHVIKESKDLEDQFRRVQKPWAKKLSKVMKCKKEYHLACKNEKSAKLQQANAKGDSSITQEQVKKIDEKVNKCDRDVDATQDKYKASLEDLKAYNPKYIEDMTDVYEKCQEMESKRLQFFKEMLFGIHSCVTISDNLDFPQIFKDMHSTISNADYQRDLKWWSNNRGVDMPMAWPRFEEYSTELKPISGKSRKNHSNNDGITLTNIVHQKTGSFTSERSSDEQKPYTNEAFDSRTSNNTTANNQKESAERKDSYDPHLNPFLEDEDVVDAASAPDAASADVSETSSVDSGAAAAVAFAETPSIVESGVNIPAKTEIESEISEKRDSKPDASPETEAVVPGGEASSDKDEFESATDESDDGAAVAPSTAASITSSIPPRPKRSPKKRVKRQAPREPSK
ncbi:protein kinase C and casein kinase substrate in neurons protein 1-like isoform X1 [Tubulanus polymorphus]|uniref:protein kinase C and casein kinase substrate in neurons protein 1-like isoform X1 n=1 Tax=Tubulanus polymorphus TaxID=672921 RepID=UPI003DA5E13C